MDFRDFLSGFCFVCFVCFVAVIIPVSVSAQSQQDVDVSQVLANNPQQFAKAEALPQVAVLPPASNFPWTMFLPAITHVPPASPESYWSAILTNVFCQTSALTFSLSSSGVTKESVCQAGYCLGGTGTLEGWVTTTPGLKAFSWGLSSTCLVRTGGFNYTLVAEKNYRFSMELNISNQPVVRVYTGTGKPQGASFGVRMQEGTVRHDQLNSMWKLVDEIPLDVPKGIFGNSQKSLMLIDK